MVVEVKSYNGVFSGCDGVIMEGIGACEEQDRGRLSEGMLKAI